MLRQPIIVATIFVALAASQELCAQAAPQQASVGVQKQSLAKRSGAKSKLRGKQAKQQETVILAPPPPPPTPEHMPSVAPEVLYQGGLLTIKAPNSTMNDVLSAVRRVTGATIEKPPVGGSDRVVAQLGPGQPKDVLEALFNGSRYDYIILGSMTRPGGVDRVILTAKATTGGTSAAVANDQPGGRPPRPNVQPVQNADQDEPEADTEDMSVPERDQAEPEQPDQQQQQPQQQVPQQPPGMPVAPPQEQSQQQGQNPDQNQQPRVKSPDELLRELQQMQKQPPDQNQQQEQNPPQ
jgi:hypothetical protein